MRSVNENNIINTLVNTSKSAKDIAPANDLAVLTHYLHNYRNGVCLFAIIGGFRMAMQNLGGKCVFSSELDKEVKKTYFANYGE